MGEQIGAGVASMDADAHDQLCALGSATYRSWSRPPWPRLWSMSMARTLRCSKPGGRALREMTRISASPYSMWRDVALTNKKNIRQALLKLEQRLAHIRENLDTRELALEFERARRVQKEPATEEQRHRENQKMNFLLCLRGEYLWIVS